MCVGGSRGAVLLQRPRRKRLVSIQICISLVQKQHDSGRKRQRVGRNMCHMGGVGLLAVMVGEKPFATQHQQMLLVVMVKQNKHKMTVTFFSADGLRSCDQKGYGETIVCVF